MVVLLVILLLQQSVKPTAFIPTSSAVDVARVLARDLGFASDKSVYFFDLMLTPDGKPPEPGYVSLGFFGNGNLLQEFAINEATGQVVDPRTCQLFEFPDLLVFQRRQQVLNGVTPEKASELMAEVGCDHLTTVRRPIARTPRPAKH